MSTTAPGRDEQRLAELGYSQDLTRAWSGFSNFAISFTIISILAGCFTTYGQAWNNGGPIAISIGWPLISCPILIIAFCMSELVSAYPTAGGIYWWASELGGAALGLVHRLVQPRRPRRRRGLGRLRLRDVHLGAAEPLERRPRDRQLRRRSLARRRVHRLRGRARAARAGQHLLVATSSRCSTTSRSGGTSAGVAVILGDPGLRSRPPRELLDSSSPRRSTTRASATGMFWFYVLPLGFLLTQYTITGFDASAHISEETHGAEEARAEGRLALGLLLGADRLGPAAGDHVRGRGHRARSPRPAARRSRSSTARCRPPRRSS